MKRRMFALLIAGMVAACGITGCGETQETGGKDAAGNRTKELGYNEDGSSYVLLEYEYITIIPE